jgi:hypothetical protein
MTTNLSSWHTHEARGGGTYHIYGHEAHPDAIPIASTPVRGKFSDWRVRLARPTGVESPQFDGARERRCWMCNPTPLDDLDPQQMAEICFFYDPAQRVVFGRCERCGALGGWKVRR